MHESSASTQVTMANGVGASSHSRLSHGDIALRP